MKRLRLNIIGVILVITGVFAIAMEPGFCWGNSSTISNGSSTAPLMDASLPGLVSFGLAKSTASAKSLESFRENVKGLSANLTSGNVKALADIAFDSHMDSGKNQVLRETALIPLCQILNNQDQNGDPRSYEAIIALMHIGDSGAVRPLLNNLDKRILSTGYMAIRAVTGIISGMGEENGLRKELSEAAFSKFTEVMGNKGSSTWVKAEIAERVGELDITLEQKTALLTSAIADTDFGVQAAAMQSLIESKGIDSAIEIVDGSSFSKANKTELLINSLCKNNGGFQEYSSYDAQVNIEAKITAKLKEYGIDSSTKEIEGHPVCVFNIGGKEYVPFYTGYMQKPALVESNYVRWNQSTAVKDNLISDGDYYVKSKAAAGSFQPIGSEVYYNAIIYAWDEKDDGFFYTGIGGHDRDVKSVEEVLNPEGKI